MGRSESKQSFQDSQAAAKQAGANAQAAFSRVGPAISNFEQNRQGRGHGSTWPGSSKDVTPYISRSKAIGAKRQQGADKNPASLLLDRGCAYCPAKEWSAFQAATS